MRLAPALLACALAVGGAACEPQKAAPAAPQAAPTLTTICRYRSARLLGPRDTYYTRLDGAQGQITASPPERVVRLREISDEGVSGLWWRPRAAGEVTFTAPGARAHRVTIASPGDIDRIALVGPSPETAQGAHPVRAGELARFDVAMWRGQERLCNMVRTPIHITLSPARRCALHDPQQGTTTTRATLSVLAREAGACVVSLSLPELDGGKGLTLDAELEVSPQQPTRSK